LSLSLIQKIVVIVKKKKQSIGINRSNESKMYYFDMRTLVATLLSFTWTIVFHIDMTKIVDMSSEYWHFNFWDFSIRICEQDYVQYKSNSIFFSSDFIDYRCQIDCLIFHTDQVVFFDRNRRSSSTTTDKILLRIKQIRIIKKLNSQSLSVLNSLISDDELILIENDDVWIQFEQIIDHRSDICIKRETIDNSFKKSSSQMFIKHVFNTRTNIFRICDQLCFLRDELELMTFDREFLTSQLNREIQFCSFVIFVDAFDLYRNMYRFLIEVYALSTTLSHKERQKSINCFVLTLDSHEVNFRNIIIFLRIEIETFDRDCQLRINEVDIVVWVFIIAFLKNMKQQQKSAEFLEFRITKCCRFCDADVRNRSDLNKDVVANERYHFQIQNLRKEMTKLFEVIRKKEFLIKQDLFWESSVFENITSALNVTVSFSSDSVHSEYYELIRRLYSIMRKNILTSQTFQ
jgi:hypothetical protein